MAKGTTSLADLLERSQPKSHPLFTFQWECISISGGGVTLSPTYVCALDIPFSNTSIGQGWFGTGTYTYFPEFTNISDISITFYENSACDIQRNLAIWKNKVVNYTASGGTDFGSRNAIGAYALPSAYKGNAKFRLMAVNREEVMSVEFTGIWPAETTALSLSYDSSDIIKITQQFSVDGQNLTFAGSNLESPYPNANKGEVRLETNFRKLRS